MFNFWKILKGRNELLLCATCVKHHIKSALSGTHFSVDSLNIDFIKFEFGPHCQVYQVLVMVQRQNDFVVTWCGENKNNPNLENRPRSLHGDSTTYQATPRGIFTFQESFRRSQSTKSNSPSEISLSDLVRIQHRRAFEKSGVQWRSYF